MLKTDEAIEVVQNEVANDQAIAVALEIPRSELPVIDLTDLRHGDAEAVSRVAQELGDAARNSGFFYISGHGIPQDLIDSVFAVSKQFHATSRSF